jgi:3-oxoacyl-ACP reductase-like protein
MNSEEFLKFQAEQHEFAYPQINLHSRYWKRDPRQGEILYDKKKASSAQVQAWLDSIASEHGGTYIDGIQSVFDALKARHFNSSWNWVRQDAILMFYDILFSCLTTVDHEITVRCIAITNRLWSISAIPLRVRRTQLQRSSTKSFGITAAVS